MKNENKTNQRKPRVYKPSKAQVNEEINEGVIIYNPPEGLDIRELAFEAAKPDLVKRAKSDEGDPFR